MRKVRLNYLQAVFIGYVVICVVYCMLMWKPTLPNYNHYAVAIKLCLSYAAICKILFIYDSYVATWIKFNIVNTFRRHHCYCQHKSILTHKNSMKKWSKYVIILWANFGYAVLSYAHFIIQIKEVQKYYANIPGVCDLVQKCLQVSRISFVWPN